MVKKFKSEVSAALHEMAAGLHQAGHLDAATMRAFDSTRHNVDDIIKKLPKSRRKKIEKRAAELIAEEMPLQE